VRAELATRRVREEESFPAGLYPAQGKLLPTATWPIDDTHIKFTAQLNSGIYRTSVDYKTLHCQIQFLPAPLQIAEQVGKNSRFVQNRDDDTEGWHQFLISK